MKELILILLLFSVDMKVPSVIPYRYLTWNDFVVKKVSDNTAAETVTSISYNYDGYDKVEVKCDLIKGESYVIENAKTDYILNHEQKHFDITYIYAVTFENIIKQKKELSDKLVDDIYNMVISQKDSMQTLYDQQTNHSENKEIQKLWDKKIETMLNNLQWQ